MHPSEFDRSILLSKNSAEKGKVPPLSGDLSIYKGEVGVNHYQDGFINSSAGVFIRVGAQEKELNTDKLIRLGPAYVTDDPTTSVAPSIKYTGDSADDVVEAGQLWFRLEDNSFFVNDGSVWQRVTPVAATQTEAGVVRLATYEQILTGLDTNSAVTPSLLYQWKEANQLLSPLDSSLRLYVDSYNGDDSLENNGQNEYNPFKTIERALIEVAKYSYNPGEPPLVDDKYAFSTIYVAPGDYEVDNRPGSPTVDSLSTIGSDNQMGPIQPFTLPGKVINFSLTKLELSVSTQATQFLKEGLQIFSSSGGHAIIDSMAFGIIVLRRVKGSWLPGDSIYIPQHYLFNSPDGGVIVPRGCSIISTDLRHTKISPKYLGDLSEFLADVKCAGSGRTSIFKLTGGSYLHSLTFVDNETMKETHHLVTAIEFASVNDLDNQNFGYYRKIFKVFQNTVDPFMIDGQLNRVSSETQIATNTNSSSGTDLFGLRVVDSVAAASPYIINCSIRSRFGLCGVLIDGKVVTGLRSMVIAQFTCVSLQTESVAFRSDLDNPGGTIYKPEWRHFAFKATNNAYAQLVNCFAIGSAIHYQSTSGADLSLSNCCSNFGDLSLVADGYSTETLAIDANTFISDVIPPLPINIDEITVPILPIISELSTPTKLYVEGEISGDRINPFSFVPGETLYVRGNDNADYVAKLETEEPLFVKEVLATATEELERWYFRVQGDGNSIYALRDELDGISVEVRRTPDERKPDDRIYWLQIQGVGGLRPSKLTENFILRLAPEMGNQLMTNLFLAAVRSTDAAGVPLPPGTYHISLLSALGVNDKLTEIYPPLNVDFPVENSASSLSYKATYAFLKEAGFSESEVLELMVASDSPLALPSTVNTELVKPSIIRSSNHTWEWTGYNNYSSALPKFQTKRMTFRESITHLKRETNGGRIYVTGMDQDGNYLIGDKVVDLKTGDELDLNAPLEGDTKVFKRLTVTERLLMYPNSTIDLRSAQIGIDVRTRFINPITSNSNFEVYASTAQAGFVQLATALDVELGTDNKKVVTPQTASNLLKKELSKGSLYTIYVDNSHPDANDAPSNRGLSSSKPFKTIPRALIQAAAMSAGIEVGGLDDSFEVVTIHVQPGTYVLSNYSGSVNTDSIKTIAVADKDNPDFELVCGSYREFNPSGLEGDAFGEQTFVEGGLIVPRGCSIISSDFRKTKIRPGFVETEYQTSIFRLTGGTYVSGLSFFDRLGVKTSHHKCNCFTLCSESELGLYYQKIAKAWVNLLDIQDWSDVEEELRPVSPALAIDKRIEEYQIVGNSVTPVIVNSGNRPVLATTIAGSSPYVYNCSLRSELGLCGLLVDGRLVTGFKSMLVGQFSGVSLQTTTYAFTDNNPESSSAQYKEGFRHYHIKADNDAFVQAVSCFAIGYADHYLALNGADVSLNNCSSNFGNTALVARGYKSKAYPKDSYGEIVAIIPPRGLPVDMTQDGSNQPGLNKVNIGYLDVRRIVNAANDNVGFRRLYIGDVITEDQIPEYIYNKGQADEERYLKIGDGRFLLGKRAGVNEKVYVSAYDYSNGTTLSFTSKLFSDTLRQKISDGVFADPITGNNRSRQYYTWLPTGNLDSEGKPLGQIYIHVNRSPFDGVANYADSANGRYILYRLFQKNANVGTGINATFTGRISASIAAITSLSSTAGLTPGIVVTGTGVQQNTTITQVTNAVESITMSANSLVTSDDFAFFSITGSGLSSPMYIYGRLTQGSNLITDIRDTLSNAPVYSSALAAGQQIINEGGGNEIPVGTTISSVSYSPCIVLSKPAIASGVGVSFQASDTNNSLYEFGNRTLFTQLYTQRIIDARAGIAPSEMLWQIQYKIPKTALNASAPEPNYVIQTRSNEDDINDVFWIYDVQTHTPYVQGVQDGIYNLLLIYGSVSGSRNQNVNFLYPEIYLDKPQWNPNAAESVYNLGLGSSVISDSNLLSSGYDRIGQYSLSRETIDKLVTALNLRYKETETLFSTTTPYGGINVFRNVNGFEEDIEERKLLLIERFVELRRPSTIRASGHTWEYVGYGSGNYAAALPQFRDITLTMQQMSNARAIETLGGFISSSGTNNSGDIFVGNHLFDSRGVKNAAVNTPKLLTSAEAREIDYSNPEALVNNTLVDYLKNLSQAFTTSNLSVTGLTSTTNLRVSQKVDFSEATSLLPPADKDRAGFITLAGTDDVILAKDDSKAVTPALLPIYVSSRLSAVVKNIVSVRMSPFADTSVPRRSGSSNTLYLHPYGGNELSVFDPVVNQWIILTLPSETAPAAFNIASIGGISADTVYDVYAYNKGTIDYPEVGIELLPWTNVAIPPERGMKNGVVVKATNISRRYIGVLRTTTAGTTQIDIGGVKGVNDPASTCYVANLYNKYDITMTFFFATPWNAPDYNLPVLWRVPPGYTTKAQCRYVLADFTPVTAFLDIYSNGDEISVLYVAPGIDSTAAPPPDAFYGEMGGANRTAGSSWIRTQSAGYHFIQYLCIQFPGSNIVNEHPAHGMIVSTKV